MPRVRSQYIAEMRERFEVVDRVKASAEEKASLTKAIQDEESSSPEVSPSKENTLRKDEVVKLTFEDDEKTSKKEENSIEKAEDNEDDNEEDVETGIKVIDFAPFS